MVKVQTVHIKVNKDVLDKIKNACKTLYVGYKQSETYDNGRNVAEVALINEYGFGHNPPRPFIRTTFEDNKEEYERLAKTGLKHMTPSNAENKIKKCLEELGERTKRDIQRTIESWDISDPRPNSPVTVAIKEAKGAKDPNAVLIDSGKMKESVEWKVDK